MKHWTEPNGIFLIHIPIDWQYLNPAFEWAKEESPYGFRPYDNGVGYFQISCYPVEQLAPELAKINPNGVPKLTWNKRAIEDVEFQGFIYNGALADQALIGKYFYHSAFKKDQRVIQEQAIAEQAMNSIVIVPKHDRKLAADLDKYDRFAGSLAASYDLLDVAIDSRSYIQIIAVAANQIDAFLRLSIVLSTQLKKSTNEVEIQYLYQGEQDKAIMERKIFDEALKLAVIDERVHKELNSLYELRNRVIHRYIISDLKTRDLINIVERYLQLSEVIRLILQRFEELQFENDFGIYGKRFHRDPDSEEMGVRHLYSTVNDKHLLTRFRRNVSQKPGS